MLSTALLERKLADCFLHTHALQTQANPHTAPVRSSGRPEPGQAGGRQRPSGEAEGGEPRTVKSESRHGALAARQRSGDRPRPRIADLIVCAHRTGPTPPQATAALGTQHRLAHSRAAQQGSRAHVRVPY